LYWLGFEYTWLGDLSRVCIFTDHCIGFSDGVPGVLEKQGKKKIDSTTFSFVE
jgi:hypothetical protein